MFQTVTGSKNLKKAAAIAALLAMFVQPTTAFASGIKKASEIQGNQLNNIYFGQYWQTADTAKMQAEIDAGTLKRVYTDTTTGKTYTVLDNSGKTTTTTGDALTAQGKTATDYYKIEGVKYRVLANNATTDADGNLGLLLLSDKVLYADAFQADASTNQWKDSQIRTTLNNTTAGSGFAGDSFSTVELAAINQTEHKQGGRYAGNESTSTEKIFLLSYEDTQRTDYGFDENTGESTTRIARATDFVQNVKMYGNTEVSYVYFRDAYWWLRSPGSSGNYAHFVYDDGEQGDFAFVYFGSISARAALNLDSSSILFLSAAAGGKSTVAVGSGFALPDYTGTDYKITLTDSTLSKPTVALKINNGNLDGTFSGASTGAKKYLSVWLLDADRNSINYAKLADCSTAGSGNFSALSFANVPDGKYILQFFSEEANGVYLSDYASEVYEQSVSVSGGKVTQLNPAMPTTDKGGSGGCNAGFGVLALLFAVPMFYRRKK